MTLYVTENGAAFDDFFYGDPGDRHVPDTDRVAFLRSHLGAVLDAIDEGVDVQGFFYWSLMDNFEWAWGYHKRFGLLYVDYQTQERTLKDSGAEYTRIIADRMLHTEESRS